MRREEATSLLKRILISCNPQDVTYISLKQPNPKTNVDSEGYELHLKWNIDDHTFTILKGIVTEANLSFKEYNGLLVIYNSNRTWDNLTVIV